MVRKKLRISMCTEENLELFSKALYPIRYMASLYYFIAGCVIAGNVHLSQAFGKGMTGIGAFLVICSFWNFGAASIMHAGMRRHNKFIVLMALILDFGLAGVQLTLGSVMYMRTLPDFSEVMQQDCLLKVPTKYTLDECLEYTRSDRYASMMLVWRSYNYLSLDYTKYYQRLVTMEQDGVCCGFGPPTRCTGDSRDFPSWANENEVGFGTDQRYVCGKEYVDETAVFPEIGGCKYDYPIGDCMDIDVDISDTVRGCASELEGHMTDKIIVHSLFIMGLSSLLFASVLSGCCMFWKRSYTDSFPDHVDRHVPWDPYKDKGILGESNKAGGGQKRRDGEKKVKLDPLGIRIMGEMPEITHRKIMPI